MTTIKNRLKASTRQKIYIALLPRERDFAPDFKMQDINGENPIRLYLSNPGGVVVYAGGLGPSRLKTGTLSKADKQPLSEEPAV